jgi:hypothetical protein
VEYFLTFCDTDICLTSDDRGVGKTTSLLSASFRCRDGYIWQAILT